LTLEPLLQAESLIQVHTVIATAAIVIGAVQPAAPKGTIPHRALGWTWVALIAAMVIVAFLNSRVSLWDPFGPSVCCKDGSCGRNAPTCASVHLISMYFILVLPFAVLHARRLDIVHHRRSMLWLYLGVLLIGAAFTFLPHRIMHAVAFGTL
jgi:uncharacterized membrane protein